MAGNQIYYGRFPNEFFFGTATAAYQIEGAWNEDGKGENIWDRFTHQTPENIVDGTNGDIAADSYHKYPEDIKALKELGVKFYRFSISWSRILPKGDASQKNPKGIEYYNTLINELISNGIEPMVTLFHWDLPQPLQDIGGWANEVVAYHFADYARVAFAEYGDRVKWWLTLNEPWVHGNFGYGVGSYAPGVKLNGIANYLAGHTMLKAHTLAYEVYQQDFKASQKGKVGITLDSFWMAPKTGSGADQDAANRAMQFQLGWFAHPIFSKEGDYPAIMKQKIAERSENEGYPRSRLPTFSPEWINRIRGASDFLGINHYTTFQVSAGSGNSPLFLDAELDQSYDDSWPKTSAPWLRVVPWGLRSLLNWIKKEYDNPPVIITENGCADSGGLNDTQRANYYRSYINEMLKAINMDGCNVHGYMAWTLIDDMEWIDGYTIRFGLYSVDFEDPERPRAAKESARVYAEIVKNRGFPEPQQQRIEL
ncbi:myrosinase 1 isoform X2 [Ischnura elegans]|nr:myrosinase 1 isoform X2 [Ischnura elegans]XP_046382663.1 myrosinase 1 isoform X2 [Ischnura elegans]